ncbi:unnamed protein product [Thelazia callipaeda]|uniref:Uncharacterized protein n=1 Tax=Thelazia callipaeda TaxID=103827 RepID=A0A0N5D597_THECL|nr:unnamed protein product [Thelazia callipaeda]
MMRKMRTRHFHALFNVLTEKFINQTITTFVRAAFKAVKSGEHPALPPCPQGCEKSAGYLILWTSISASLVVIFTFMKMIGSVVLDWRDSQYAVEQEMKAIQTLKEK